MGIHKNLKCVVPDNLKIKLLFTEVGVFLQLALKHPLAVNFHDKKNLMFFIVI